MSAIRSDRSGSSHYRNKLIGRHLCTDLNTVSWRRRSLTPQGSPLLALSLAARMIAPTTLERVPLAPVCLRSSNLARTGSRRPSRFTLHPSVFARVHQLNPCTKDSVAPTGAQELGTSPSWASQVTRGLTTTAVTPPASSLPASGPAACSSWWPPPSRGCRGRARSRSSCCPPPPTDWAAASFCSISR